MNNFDYENLYERKLGRKKYALRFFIRYNLSGVLTFESSTFLIPLKFRKIILCIYYHTNK
eukprot:UN23325